VLRDIDCASKPERQTQMPVDLQFHNHGSFASCTPVSEEGSAWLADNIGTPETAGALTWIGETVAIDFRCLEEIVEGARADGLIVAG
jgi:hypothetical protein